MIDNHQNDSTDAFTVPLEPKLSERAIQPSGSASDHILLLSASQAQCSGRIM